MSTADDTPTRLVLAAERLFAEGGEDATSLRAIARAALSNSAAVHYHFGGRDQLLAAVVDRHLAPLAVRRGELLAQVVAAHPDPAPADVLEACLRPDVEYVAKLRKRRVGVARFLGRAMTQPEGPVAALVARQFDAMAERAVPLLARSLGQVGADELRRRLWLTHTSVAMLYATAPPPGGVGPLGVNDVEEQLALLVSFAAPGLSAPVTRPVVVPVVRKRKSR